MKTRQEEKEERLKEEKLAIEFVKDLHNQFTTPIIENLDKFLSNQEYDEDSKRIFRKTLMISIANGILIKSGASKKELKESYRGLMSDYHKIKDGN